MDHFIRWEIEECEIAFGPKTSQLISPTFDAFLRDIFVPLCSGGTICLPPMVEGSIDANSLCAWIEEEKVNVIHCVPTLLRTLLNAASTRTMQSVTHLFVSGEVLTPGDVGRWFQCCNGHQARLINLYGPSETTMTKFAYFVKSGDQELGAIPIGKPIRGAEAILLNQHGRPSPVGAIGEIYIRTAYRSLGYYGKPDLDKEAFIANPFRNDPTDLLYKTGDIGRILEDGNYEFLGRSDSQIKLRGIRIELSEIEAVIRTCPQIQDCVVVALEAPSGEKSLCAYYVSSVQVNSADLRDFVGQRLPEYMRPAAYVELTKLPLLSNGKVDRSQLPAPQQWLQGEHLPPANTVEEILCGIWEEVLRLEKVGVEDNFFALGGHSLMATQVISHVRQVFNCEVSLRAFLQQPTIRKLAHEVEQQTQDPTLKMVTSISVVSRKERGLPLSFAQQRLWFLAQMEGVSVTYHIPVALRLRGKLDGEALKRSLDTIWARHEGLRSVFVVVEGEPQVELLPVETGMPLLEHDLRGIGDAEAQLKELMIAEAQAPFDLKRGPLIRAHLVADGGRGACIAADAAPYCVGRVVDGGAGAGVGNVVWGFQPWGGESIGAARDPVSGLCGVAAGVAEGGEAGEAERVLEGGAGGCTGAAGVADGSSAAGAAELCWGMRADGDRAGVGGRAEGAEPAAWDDIVHDVVERMGGGVVTVIGTGGGGDWDNDGESWMSGDGGVDRIFCEYGGVAGGYRGRAEGGRVAGACEKDSVGGAGASGCAV